MRGTRTCASRVAPLYDESLDVSVKQCVVVLAARAQGQKVLRSARTQVTEDFQLKVSLCKRRGGRGALN